MRNKGTLKWHCLERKCCHSRISGLYVNICMMKLGTEEPEFDIAYKENAASQESPDSMAMVKWGTEEP